MSSKEPSTVKRKRGFPNRSRPRGHNGRTASLPNPKRVTSSSSNGLVATFGRKGNTTRTSALHESGSDFEDDLVDNEAEEATEGHSEDGSENTDGDESRSKPLGSRGVAKSVTETTVISSSPEPEYMIAELVDEADEREHIESSDPQVPPKLLTRLLYYHMQHDKTKIAKDANLIVAKYIDVFVRESIARATHERREKFGNDMHGVDNFLEVEDLEKGAPQLVLDF